MLALIILNPSWKGSQILSWYSWYMKGVTYWKKTLNYYETKISLY